MSSALNLNAVYFGVTRFSVYIPNSNAWNLSGGTEKEYVSKLFSDERLAPRFNIFINYALPIYQKFSFDYDYKHIVLYSGHMPDKWKEELVAAAEKYSFLVLREVTDSIYFMDIMEGYLASIRNINSPVALFRIDDDDLLSEDYLDQLAQYTDFPFAGMSVSFGSAVAAKFSDNRFCDFRKVKRPLLSMGQASIGSYDASSKKLSMPRAVNHIETDVHRPVILDSRKPAFVWTHHEFQDSNQTKGDKSGLSKLEKDFLLLQPIDDISVIVNFPTLVEDYIFSNQNIVTRSQFSNFDWQKKFDFSETKISDSGDYRIVYELRFKNNQASQIKSLILYFGETAGDIDFMPGMMKSTNKDIGWFKYLNSSEGLAKGYFDIHIPQNVDVKTVTVKCWSLDEVFKVVNLKVEKVR